MPFNYNISEYKYGYISQWNGLAFLSTFIKLHPSDQELADKLLCFIRYTLNLNFHEDTCEVLPSADQMFLQHGFFSSCASAAGDLGWDSVTAFIDPRVTSLLLTFLWISERNRPKTIDENRFFLCTDTIHVFVYNSICADLDWENYM